MIRHGLKDWYIFSIMTPENLLYDIFFTIMLNFEYFSNFRRLILIFKV